MAVEITGKYLGNKRVEMTHGPSGSVIKTDAPKESWDKRYAPKAVVQAKRIELCVLGFCRRRETTPSVSPA